jgi:ribokinase
VVGSLVMDLVFRVPRRPEPDDVVVADDFAVYRGGKGYNQAVALSRLGAEVAMVGAVGDDAHGEEFRAALAREGVDASRLVTLAGARTAVAVPLVTPDGEVAFVQHPGANRLLAPEHCADLPAGDLLLLQGEVPAATSQHAAEAVHRRGGQVVLNPAPVGEIDRTLVEIAHVITPNRVEGRDLAARLGLALDADFDRATDPAEALARSLAGSGRRAVITLGARGAAWADGNGSGTVAPPSVGAVDATGAGDSFNAALALAVAEGQHMASAVAFACAAGAHAATVAGAEPGLPTRAQVEALRTG